MKKYIVLYCCCLTSLLFITNNKVTAQKENEYKPWLKYKGDTLQYLYQNFVLRKGIYIGEPLGVLFNEIEVPVTSCIVRTIHGVEKPANEAPFDGNTIIDPSPGGDRISLLFYDKVEDRNKLALSIQFEPLANMDSQFVLIRKRKNLFDWAKEEKIYYSKFIVKDIGLIKLPDRFQVSSPPSIDSNYLAKQNKLYHTGVVSYFINDTLLYTLKAYRAEWLDSFGQNDSIILKLSLIEKGPVLNGMFYNTVLKMNLYSKCKQKIKVQNERDFFVDEENNNSSGDAFFEVRSINAVGIDSLAQKADDSNCDPVTTDFKQSLKILSEGQSINYTYYGLGCYYQFRANHIYRIRACYKLSKFNSLGDVFSNWLTIKF